MDTEDTVDPDCAKERIARQRRDVDATHWVATSALVILWPGDRAYDAIGIVGAVGGVQ